MPTPSHTPLFHHPISTWRLVQTIQPLILQFYPLPRYLPPLSASVLLSTNSRTIVQRCLKLFHSYYFSQSLLKCSYVLTSKECAAPTAMIWKQ